MATKTGVTVPRTATRPTTATPPTPARTSGKRSQKATPCRVMVCRTPPPPPPPPPICPVVLVVWIRRIAFLRRYLSYSVPESPSRKLRWRRVYLIYRPHIVVCCAGMGYAQAKGAFRSWIGMCDDGLLLREGCAAISEVALQCPADLFSCRPPFIVRLRAGAIARWTSNMALSGSAEIAAQWLSLLLRYRPHPCGWICHVCTLRAVREVYNRVHKRRILPNWPLITPIASDVRGTGTPHARPSRAARWLPKWSRLKTAPPMSQLKEMKTKKNMRCPT